MVVTGALGVLTVAVVQPADGEPATRLIALQVAVVATAMGAGLPILGERTRHALLPAASVLVGLLLLVFERTYAIDPHAWPLFARWSLLILPWTLAGRNAAAWLVWLAVTQIALGLVGDEVVQAGSPMVLPALRSLGLLNYQTWSFDGGHSYPVALLLMVGPGLLLLAARQIGKRHCPWLAPAWVGRVLVADLLALLLGNGVLALAGPLNGSWTLILAGLVLAGLRWRTFRAHARLLRAAVLLVAVTATVALFDIGHGGINIDEIGLMFLALGVIYAFGRAILRTAHHHDGAADGPILAEPLLFRSLWAKTALFGVGLVAVLGSVTLQIAERQALLANGALMLAPLDGCHKVPTVFGDAHELRYVDVVPVNFTYDVLDKTWLVATLARNGLILDVTPYERKELETYEHRLAYRVLGRQLPETKVNRLWFARTILWDRDPGCDKARLAVLRVAQNGAALLAGLSSEEIDKTKVSNPRLELTEKRIREMKINDRFEPMP